MRETRPADEGDFRGFVDARWPVLVRTLVLLGCPAELAPEVAATGLARCRAGWGRSVQQDDPDVVAHRAVLAAWDERRRGRWWEHLGPPPEDAPDLSALDRLRPEVRAGVVLRRYAGFEPGQAAAVAGPDAGGDLPADPDPTTLRLAADALVVLPPPPERLGADRPAGWRRRVPAVVALAVAAGAAGAVWWTQSSDEEADSDGRSVRLEAVDPRRTPNPADVAWYADGVLHLEHATYVLPTLRDLAVLGSGAVYGDVEGRVVHLADDGTRTLLGRKRADVPFATSDALGWVAWVDAAGATPRLLVYDVDQADIIGTLDLPASRSAPEEEPDTRPVAIDREAVYFVTSEGARAWRPTRDPGFVETLEPPRLLDVASSTRVSQIGNQVLVVDEPFVVESVTVPGRGAELSADGELLVTHDPADGELVVFDVGTGGRLDVRPPGGFHAVDAVLAPAGSITYLTVDPDGFATQSGNDSNPVRGELVTCRIDDGVCVTLATLVLDSEAPILAR